MHRSLHPSALIPPGLILDQIHADPQQVTMTVHIQSPIRGMPVVRHHLLVGA